MTMFNPLDDTNGCYASVIRFCEDAKSYLQIQELMS